MKRKKQDYRDRVDESLGERRGPEDHFRQTLQDRRDESKDMRKGGRYKDDSGDHDMDDYDKSRLRHHMMSAHHKFMSQHHRRKMHKKK